MKGQTHELFARILPVFLAVPLIAQTPQQKPADDLWKSLHFLEGTWQAQTSGASGVSAAGTYTFRSELGNHILARHSTTTDGCKGPANYDCYHGDFLYIYQDASSQHLKAIDFDNEGHVIHYNVSTPDSTTAIFLSDQSEPGPSFRLVYKLQGPTMSGIPDADARPDRVEILPRMEWPKATLAGVCVESTHCFASSSRSKPSPLHLIA